MEEKTWQIIRKQKREIVKELNALYVVVIYAQP